MNYDAAAEASCVGPAREGLLSARNRSLGCPNRATVFDLLLPFADLSEKAAMRRERSIALRWPEPAFELIRSS